MQDNLVDVRTASKALGVSAIHLYRLPDYTPGIYRIGKCKRFNVCELREWARGRGKADVERSA